MSFYPERGQQEGDVTDREVARVAIVGQAILYLIGRGLLRNPQFDVEVAQCREEVIIGHQVGVEMTPFRKKNLTAAFALQQLPICFTKPKQLLTSGNLPNTIWTGITNDALRAIDCVTSQNHPTTALRLAMPFLESFYPPRRQMNIQKYMPVLPASAHQAFSEMWPISRKLATQLPIVTARQSGCEPPRSIEYFDHLTLNNANAYLTNLLNYMFELDAKLHEADDDVRRGHFIY